MLGSIYLFIANDVSRKTLNINPEHTFHLLGALSNYSWLSDSERRMQVADMRCFPYMRPREYLEVHQDTTG